MKDRWMSSATDNHRPPAVKKSATGNHDLKAAISCHKLSSGFSEAENYTRKNIHEKVYVKKYT
jgi:hypothetical protein